jgi:hypothetical protein
MVADETETLTFRLPSALKALVEQFAEGRGTTVTAVVRDALQDFIAPPQQRVYELPGFSPKLDELVSDARPGPKPMMILVVIDRDPRKMFFEGELDRNLTNETVLALKRKGKTPWIILRRDIAAWFDGAAASMNQLAIALTGLGWTAMSKDLY